MSQKALVEATPVPVTIASLADDLTRLGLRPGTVVCLHSSLSRLGWVCGGAVAVVEALRRVLGATGTLVVPTHTSGLTDPAWWQNPAVPEDWWSVIRDQMPPYRAGSTPSESMGAVAEAVRTWPGTRRSDHPQVSFAALGPAAATITDAHRLDHMLGEGSPLARLYDLDAQVLLLGVGYDRNTSLHLAEYRSGVRATATESSPVFDGEGSVWRTWDDIDLDEDDFPAIGAAFEQTDQVRVGAAGIGPARLMSQRALVDFATEWLRHRHAPDATP